MAQRLSGNLTYCKLVTASPERRGRIFWDHLWHMHSERKRNIPQKPHRFKDLLGLKTENSCIKNPLRFSPASELNKTSDHIIQPQGSWSPRGEGLRACRILKSRRLLLAPHPASLQASGQGKGLCAAPGVFGTRGAAHRYAR